MNYSWVANGLRRKLEELPVHPEFPQGAWYQAGDYFYGIDYQAFPMPVLNELLLSESEGLGLTPQSDDYSIYFDGLETFTRSKTENNGETIENYRYLSAVGEIDWDGSNTITPFPDLVIADIDGEGSSYVTQEAVEREWDKLVFPAGQIGKLTIKQPKVTKITSSE